MKTFRSRIGWEIWLPVMAIIGSVCYPLLTYRAWPPLLILALVVLFTFMLVRKTTYTIMDNNRLLIQSWFLVKVEIPIQHIYRITKTWNPISSPAASLIGRLEVYYPGGSVIISPARKGEFLEALKTINPAIAVKEAFD